MNEKRKCPVCNEYEMEIADVGGTKFLQCKNYNYKGEGCDFSVPLKPKQLKGYSLSKEELNQMLDGEMKIIKGKEVSIDSKEPNKSTDDETGESKKFYLIIKAHIKKEDF